MPIAVPPYDPTGLIEFEYGALDAEVAMWAGGTARNSLASSTEQMVFAVSHFPIQNRSIRLRRFMMALCTNGAACLVDKIELVVLRKDDFNIIANGSVLTVIAKETVDITNHTGAASFLLDKVFADNTWMSLPAVGDAVDADYAHCYLGVAMHKTGASAGAGYVSNAIASAYDTYGAPTCRFTVNSISAVPAVGQTVTVAGNNVSYVGIFQLEFDTGPGTLTKVGVVSSGAVENRRLWSIRRKDNGPLYVIARNTVAKSSGDATLALKLLKLTDISTAAEVSVGPTLTFSGGTKTIGLTVDGPTTVTNNLAADETYADLYDLLWYHKAGVQDLGYINRTHAQGGGTSDERDVALISHKAKNAGTRGGSYAAANFLGQASVLMVDKVSNGSIGSIEIGTMPLISISNSRHLDLLGAAFTWPRTHIELAIGGNFMTSSSSYSTATYLRYKHSTVGQGDVCEFEDCLLALQGVGINDAANLVAVATYETRLNSIIDDWRSTGRKADRPMLLFGVGPVDTDYADAATVNAYAADYNELIRSKAMQYKIPYYDPTALLVANPSYYNADNIHYLTTTERIFEPLLVAEYENNRVPSDGAGTRASSTRASSRASDTRASAGR